MSRKIGAVSEHDELQVRLSSFKRIIGIDPGINTGIAVYDRLERKIVLADTLDFWAAYDFVQQFPRHEVAIILEDPNANKPTFARYGNRFREKISQNVGSNKAEARLLCEGLRRLGYHVRAETPTTSKWTAAEVKSITGFSARCSEHARDAIKLCYGY